TAPARRRPAVLSASSRALRVARSIKRTSEGTSSPPSGLQQDATQSSDQTVLESADERVVDVELAPQSLAHAQRNRGRHAGGDHAEHGAHRPRPTFGTRQRGGRNASGGDAGEERGKNRSGGQKVGDLVGC